MSTLTLRVPPELLVMIEPRVTKPRMAGYSLYIFCSAAMSGLMCAGSLGCAMMRTRCASMLILRYFSAGIGVSRLGEFGEGENHQVPAFQRQKPFADLQAAAEFRRLKRFGNEIIGSGVEPANDILAAFV